MAGTGAAGDSVDSVRGRAAAGLLSRADRDGVRADQSCDRSSISRAVSSRPIRYDACANRVVSLQATTQRAAPRWWEGDLVHDFIRSPVALVAAASTLLIVAATMGAGLIAPYDSNDPASANVIDARLPPGSSGMTGNYYLLGTDPQGRDMLSAILFGTRMSLMVGASSVLLAALIGIVLGLVCGYFRGLLDAVIMPIADLELRFPVILIALLLDGITRSVVDRTTHDRRAIPVLVVAI